MLVIDLFRSLDRNDIVDAYLFKYGLSVSSIETLKHTIDENIQAVRREREMVARLVDIICEHDVDDSVSSCVLFVIPYKEAIWSERGKILFDAGMVYADEAKAKITDDSWTNDGDSRVDGYAFEFTAMSEVLGYRVADVCLERVNHLDITSEILNELTMFGYDEIRRSERIESEVGILVDRVADIDKRVVNGETVGIPHDEVFARLEKSHYDSLESEDERLYYVREREFKKSVSDIRDRFMRQIMVENKKLCEDYYKAEFLK